MKKPVKVSSLSAKLTATVTSLENALREVRVKGEFADVETVPAAGTVAELVARLGASRAALRPVLAVASVLVDGRTGAAALAAAITVRECVERR